MFFSSTPVAQINNYLVLFIILVHIKVDLKL